MHEEAVETDRYSVVRLGELAPVSCPCGQARRAFASDEDGVASLHLVEISEDSKVHYHKKLTEVYFVLEGQGEMELDGRRFPVGPGTAVKIRPGCRHRAIGRLKIINMVVPAFDAADEWFDS